jgi:hypothetical protein
MNPCKWIGVIGNWEEPVGSDMGWIAADPASLYPHLDPSSLLVRVWIYSQKYSLWEYHLVPPSGQPRTLLENDFQNYSEGEERVQMCLCWMTAKGLLSYIYTSQIVLEVPLFKLSYCACPYISVN